MTMKLSASETCRLGHLNDSLRMLVTKDSDGQYLGRQAPSDVIDLLDSNLSNRWGEYKTHCVSAKRNG
jgi:hypothetical protein